IMDDMPLTALMVRVLLCSIRGCNGAAGIFGCNGAAERFRYEDISPDAVDCCSLHGHSLYVYP
ncbi:hypothetical protein, partial [Enterobacter hormaechei]|uniref:hypothetical protein n=1 Tax=Enterobacter hormaechei TaxID=158836 RepID=UPI001952C397